MNHSLGEFDLLQKVKKAESRVNDVEIELVTPDLFLNNSNNHNANSSISAQFDMEKL